MDQIILGQFKGSLEELTEAAKNQKIDLSSISISDLTSKFLRTNPDSEELSIFLDNASKIFYLKSKYILPDTSQEDLEETTNLKERQEEYQIYKDFALDLENILSLGNRSFKREGGKIELKTFSPPQNINFNQLVKIFQDVLSKIPEETKEEKIKIKKITVEEKIIFLKNYFKDNPKTYFSQLLKTARSRLELVVIFLAILELTRQKMLKIKQEKNFEDFILERK